MEQFKGKALIRKSGKYLIICGVFIPSEDMNTYSDTDEMWAVELGVIESIKYKLKDSCKSFSPEDFLENTANVQHKDNWENK